jgi:hypothetical protein
MSVNLTRRIVALEASLSPAGKIVAFWAMTTESEPMTDREIESKILALRNGGPANTQFIPVCWQVA